MSTEVLVLNAAPRVDKMYTIKGCYGGSSHESVLETDIPGLEMAQEICHELNEKYGSDYDVWISE